MADWGWDFVDLSLDVSISSLPLSWWPTSINMEVDDHLRVCDLMTLDGQHLESLGYHPSLWGLACLLDLVILILVHQSQDLRGGADHVTPRLH